MVIVINANAMGPGSLVAQTVTVAPTTVTKALVSKRRRYHGCRIQGKRNAVKPRPCQ
jgi:hypothetical protein